MHENYGCVVGLKSPAHITIIPPFWMDETKENQLTNDIAVLSSEFETFDLATNNFSAFKPRTIFIDLMTNSKLDLLKKKTDLFFNTHQELKIKTDSRTFQ